MQKGLSINAMRVGWKYRLKNYDETYEFETIDIVVDNKDFFSHDIPEPIIESNMRIATSLA